MGQMKNLTSFLDKLGPLKTAFVKDVASGLWPETHGFTANPSSTGPILQVLAEILIMKAAKPKSTSAAVALPRCKPVASGSRAQEETSVALSLISSRHD